MLYQRYENKIKRIAKIKVAVYKYRIPILIGIGVIFILIGGLLAEKGRIKEDLSLSSPSVVYGEIYECSADIFLGEPSFQYRTAAENSEWEEGLPDKAGEYKIRVKSRRIFGLMSYGEETDFVISKKPLAVYYRGTVVYGETPVSGFDTVKGDEVKDYALTEDILYVGKTDVGLKSIRIEDENGQDTTDCYEIDYQAKKSITVRQKDITVETVSFSKIYDGKPLEESEYKNCNISGVCYSDSVSFDYTVAPFTDVNEVKNGISNVKFTDGAGENRTENYNVKAVLGTLSITKRPITVKPVDLSETYADTFYSPVDCEKTEGTFAEGQNIYEFSLSGGGKQVGEYATSVNVNSIVIKDGAGTETTNNYAITLKKGKITVSRRHVNAQGETPYKVYDDEIFEKTYSDKDGLINGHNLILATEGKAAGDYSAEKLSVRVYKGYEDVSDNYDVDITGCVFTINKRSVIITTYGASKTYDATPLINKSYEITGVLSGHIEYVNCTGTITDAGETENTADYEIRGRYDYSLKTDNYDITLNCGTLTVNKRGVSFNLSGEKTYDGKNIVAAENLSLYILRDDFVSGLYSGHNAVYRWNNLSSSDHGTYHLESELLSITDANNRDVSGNYESVWTSGNFTINKKIITLISESAEKEYDRTPLTCKNFTVENGYGAAEGQEIRVITYSVITIVGDIQNELTYKVYRSGDNVETTENYLITEENSGRLVVKKIIINLKTYEKTITYNGKSHIPNENFDAPTDKLLEGDVITSVANLICNGETEKINAGTYHFNGDTDNCTVIYNDPYGNRDYYEITVSATLKINKIIIKLSSKSAKKMYDGTPLIAEEYEIAAQYGELAENDEMVIIYSGSQTEEGSSKNVIDGIGIYYGNDRIPDEGNIYHVAKSGSVLDMKNYKITVYFGTLTVIK